MKNAQNNCMHVSYAHTHIHTHTHACESGSTDARARACERDKARMCVFVGGTACLQFKRLTEAQTHTTLSTPPLLTLVVGGAPPVEPAVDRVHLKGVVLPGVLHGGLHVVVACGTVGGGREAGAGSRASASARKRAEGGG